MKKKSSAASARGKRKVHSPQVLPAESLPSRSEQSHPGGRPTLYRADFHPDDYIRLSKQGQPIWCIAAEWDIDRDTIQEWQQVHPEFSVAVKKGNQHRLRWWTTVGMDTMRPKRNRMGGTKNPINLGMFIWLSQQINGWTNNQKLEDHRKPQKEKTDAEIDAELKLLEQHTGTTGSGDRKKEDGTA